MAEQPAAYYEDPEVIKAREQAQTTAKTAADYASAGSLLPTKLRQAVQEKLDYNKDLIEQKNKAASEYFQAPSSARVKYEGIWNPFQREALVAKERAMAYQPYANLVDILGQRMGTISDIINAGVGGFQSAITGAQNAAQLARQNYQDVYGVAQDKAQYALEAYKATHPGGSGTSLGDIQALINAMLASKGIGMGAGGEAKPTKVPLNIPGGDLGNIPGLTVNQVSPNKPSAGPLFSSGGQWVWDDQSNDWVPYTEQF